MMKQVGEAVRDFILNCSYKEAEIVTIGIATWGTVYNRDSLICPMVSQAELEMHLLCLHLGCWGSSTQGPLWEWVLQEVSVAGSPGKNPARPGVMVSG